MQKYSHLSAACVQYVAKNALSREYIILLMYVCTFP